MYQNGKNITFTDRSVDSVNSFLKAISKSKPLTNEQEYDLWLLMQQGSKSAREQLVFANLRYVVKVAKQYLKSNASFEDLIQAGCEGLVNAIDKFDASLGFRLISFATWYIENEVSKAAYDYIRHRSDSLDESIDAEDEDAPTRIELLTSYPCQSSDWDLRYSDALRHLQVRAEKRQPGLGRLTADLHQMLLDGYTTSDFARKHHLNESQMNRLFAILREEATLPFSSAA